MKKKSLLTKLGITFACALVAGVAVNMSNPVQASAESKTVANVEMQQGASVRLTGTGNYADSTGIRFTMYVSKSAVDAYKESHEDAYPEVGMYVAKASDLTGDKNLTTATGIAAMQADASITYACVKMDWENNHTAVDSFEVGSETITFTSPVYVFNVVNELPSSMYGTELTANGYIKATWTNSNPEVATVDETTGAITPVGVGTTTVAATIGGNTRTATVTVEAAPATYTAIDLATTPDAYTFYDEASWIVSKDPTTVTGTAKDNVAKLTGTYESEKIGYLQNGKNRVFYFTAFDTTNIETLAKYYNTVSIWVATASDGDTTLNTADGTAAFINYATISSLTKFAWTKISISMTDFRTLLGTEPVMNNTGDKCYRLWANGGTWQDAHSYFGNMIFENIEIPATVKAIDVATTPDAYAFYDGTSYLNTSADSPTWFDATTSPVTKPAKGGMTKGRAFYFKTINTELPMSVIATRYNTVSIWVTSTSTGSRKMVSTEGKPGFIDYCTETTITIPQSSSDKGCNWMKISISMTNFCALLEQTQEKTGYYRLWEVESTWHDGALYFGDMIFENT